MRCSFLAAWWPGVVVTYEGVEMGKSALLEISGTHTSKCLETRTLRPLSSLEK